MEVRPHGEISALTREYSFLERIFAGAHASSPVGGARHVAVDPECPRENDPAGTRPETRNVRSFVERDER